MLLSSKGVVLHSIKYGDNSLISNIFSQEKGLISIISSNSKSKKNKSKNYLRPLSLVHFVCYISKKSTIYRLKEISFINSALSTEENVSINAIRFFLAEFLSKVIKEEEKNETLYSFLESKTEELYSNSSINGSYHLRFLIDLFEHLGIQPILQDEHLYFDLTEGTSTAIKPPHDNYCDQKTYSLFHNYYKGSNALSKIEKTQLLTLLIKYYNVQLGGGVENIKSKAVLEAVFN